METASVAAVILAAGEGSRFGRPKAEVRIGSRTLLGIATDAAVAAGLDPVIAVVPPGSASGAPAVVDVVTNDRPADGLSRSLQLGLAAVPDTAGAAVILLVDQPTVDATVIRHILGARGPRPLVATRSEGALSPPLLLERDAFDLAGALTGDVGLRHLLRGSPESVGVVEADHPIIDVDTPADLDRVTEACPGCGERYLPHEHDDTHPYIGASAACWAAFGELLAREFQDVTYGRMHRHTVDTYAVQHPGTDDRRQRQSVALHLIALCHWLEHDVPVVKLNALSQRLASEDGAWPWLAPPERYPMTVGDVLEARDGDEHAALVRRWALAVWNAWSTHHDAVRAWARETLDEG